MTTLRRVMRDKKSSDTPARLSTGAILESHPERGAPRTKTLLDIAKEKEADRHADMEDQQRKAGPDNSDAVLHAALYGVTLATLNFTLDVLVWHQYAQELSYKSLLRRNIFTSLPLYMTCIFVFHSPWFGIVKAERIRQALFFCCAIVCGIYAVQLSNGKGYLAVMKKAPPTGTLWVWAVLEMGPLAGVVSLFVVAMWTFVNGQMSV